MHTRGEDTGWTVWDRETRGFVSRFGNLTGLKGIKQKRQLEITPYIAHGTTDPSVDPELDGVKDEFDHAENIGMDLKLGITPNLTLNAAFQPDFGQVEADPSELNLSPFETYFDEKRPFFLDGAQYFWHPDHTMFYSRRIGTGGANSRIRMAGKVIGKTENDIALAMLYAQTDVTGNDQSHNFLKSGNQKTHYLFGKFGREFKGGANQISIAQSAVIRKAELNDSGDRNRDGYTSRVDFDLNFHDRDYLIHGSFIGSIIDPAELESDTTALMQSMQSRRYGTGGVLKLLKVGGNLNYGLILRSRDEDLDINDFGFNSSNDDLKTILWGEYSYNSDSQSLKFLNWEIEGELSRTWLYAAS